MENITKIILLQNCKKNYQNIFNNSHLIKYIDKKIGSVGDHPKRRPNLGNLYSIYVLIKDYKTISSAMNYDDYGGAQFTTLLKKIRELPGGEKIQNHALNSRVNGEFKNMFNTELEVIIIKNSKYKINTDLLIINKYNISDILIEIIEKYVKLRSDIFKQMMKKIKEINNNNSRTLEFFKSLITPISDARLFEIISFVIMKHHFSKEKLFIGENMDSLELMTKTLYKTGRTNANDGGIDFVMKPLGIFYQVTENLDFKKYFLDIDKINRFPITFVIKSELSPKKLRYHILDSAKEHYDKLTLIKYNSAIEEIINIPILEKMLIDSIKNNKTKLLLNDFETYLRVEFNMT